MRPPPWRCSLESLARDEPLAGTASLVRSWAFIEQPGPWGYDVPRQSRLPPSVAKAMVDRGRSLGIRVVLIRRPGRSSPERRVCYFAYADERARRLERVEVGDVSEILDLDWSRVPAGGPVVDGIDAAPMFAVCTNGARDRCCAERGRSVAAALAREFGDRAWECSHIGGDRFAANLLCFPHGLYFGRVHAEEAIRIARAYEASKIDLAHFRGRAGLDFAVQAAEMYVRRARALDGVDDVRFAGRSIAGDRVDVAFDVPDGRVTAAVRVSEAPGPRLLTCVSTAPSRPPAYELLEVR